MNLLIGTCTWTQNEMGGGTMPESTKDRCTRSHEYIFMLTKAQRYFYDYVAIQEPALNQTSGNLKRKCATERGCPHPGVAGNVPWEGNMRNRRDVWVINTKPFKDAHFAVFPAALIEPCILAGCPDRCCPICGKGWERMEGGFCPACTCGDEQPIPQGELDADPTLLDDFEIVPPQPVPGTVLDPFAGSGTTGMVATKRGRNAILIDLNPDYLEMMERRIREGK